MPCNSKSSCFPLPQYEQPFKLYCSLISHHATIFNVRPCLPLMKPSEDTSTKPHSSDTRMDYSHEDSDEDRPPTPPTSTSLFIESALSCRVFFQRPRPSTLEEVQAWKILEPGYETNSKTVEQREHIAKKGRQHSQQIEQLRQYKSAPTPANYEIPNCYQNTCDPILADQWKIWYHQHMLFSTKREETVDAIAVIGRWLKYSSKIPMIQNPNQEGTSEEISLAEKARSEAAERRRVKRSAVAELRKETAFTVLSERPLLELITTDSVSDYEESEDPTDPPSRILPYWRSELLGDVMHEVDLATFQLAAPNKKQEILAVLARRGSRGATEDDVPAENAPHGFPAEVYSEHFASDTSQLERGPSRYPSGRFGPISMNLSKALLTLRASTIKPQETPTGSKMPHTD
ncbi:hypothetical protein PSTT_07693 [Puccinia striiformis]|uniref:Uncharacterized protein n=1 Tax=Puccinia striiformis TaxID=27350 RepID=A0A2S4VFF4_9BASI|nr:hypothetical protein PSTT_07693 [Puccinia striiformis]